MVNKNYLKGRRYEYKVMRMLEDIGEYPIRSSGSHKLADIISFSKKCVKLIQVKTGTATMTPAEVESFKELPVPKSCIKQIWHFKGRDLIVKNI